MPGRLSSWDEYSNIVDVLVRTNVIEDASKIWWDIRPSAKFPTLESRITDVCTRAADCVAIAAIYVSICRMLFRLRRANLTWRTYPVFLLEENRWRAQRYGIEGTLFDLGKRDLVNVPTLVDELLDLILEDADALGCLKEVAHARQIITNGTSADRQLATYHETRASGQDDAASLRQVVSNLVAETQMQD